MEIQSGAESKSLRSRHFQQLTQAERRAEPFRIQISFLLMQTRKFLCKVLI